MDAGAPALRFACSSRFSGSILVIAAGIGTPARSKRRWTVTSRGRFRVIITGLPLDLDDPASLIELPSEMRSRFRHSRRLRVAAYRIEFGQRLRRERQLRSF